MPLLSSDQLNTVTFGDLTGTLTTTPTASMLQGRCGSQLSGPANAELTNIISGGNPTPGNYATFSEQRVIPTQCFDPLSTSIYNSYVNSTGTFQESPNKINNGDQFTIRVDQDS